MTRQATVEISLKKIKDNMAKIEQASPKNARVMPIIKANAYGLGATQIATALQSDSSLFGVATITEALELRNSGIQCPILLLSEPEISELDLIVKENIDITVYNKHTIQALCKRKQPISVHLKINTGMNRLGCNIEHAELLLKQIQDHSTLTLKSIFTHLADADSQKKDYSLSQIQKFSDIQDQLPPSIEKTVLFHAANTAAANHYPDTHFDLLRIGIGLYDSAIRWQSPIIDLETHKKGSLIGYNGRGKLDADASIAIIPTGYADGYPSTLSNIGIVSSESEMLYPVIATVCMDFTFINLGQNPEQLKKGDLITLLHPNPNMPHCLSRLAKTAQLNPREILCRLGQRNKRVYIND